MTIDRRRLLMLAATAAFPMASRAEALALVPLPGDVGAPDFTLADLTGRPHRLADYRGHPLLVSFWAVWCPPCRRELAALAVLRRRLEDSGIAVLAVNLGDSRERIAAFLADHPAPDLPVLLDSDKSVGAAWHVAGLPTAYAVSSNGVLRLGALGERDWLAPDIEAQLRALG
ncbi:MAG TPA: TlpA disulfide reductase family protein [Pseudolabrys sp.]|nr:TlpA disulfide reductase family protein [Pseudolabrys sp.]